MKLLLILFTAILSLGNGKNDCGDGVTYANEEQTKNDKRLADYPKIKTSPAYVDGNSEFEKLIEENLKIKEEGKNLVFRLNYMFTITCDGQVTKFKTLGDSKFSGLTNIKEIIEETNGKWKPAEKDEKPVDCVYFAKKTIIGSKY